MNRLLLVCLAVYAPHLVEEHVARMADDPFLAPALGRLAALSPQHAAYGVFQVMLALALAMAYLVGRGGRARDMVLLGLAVALLAESHHLVRALASGAYNPGLFTAPVMPLAGVFVARSVLRGPRRGAAIPA